MDFPLTSCELLACESSGCAMPRAKKDTTGVGYNLLKRQQKKPDPRSVIAAPSTHLESSVERSDLEELLSTAILADRDFTAERGLSQVVLNSEVPGQGSRERREEQKAEEHLHRSQLTIPRRPPWHSRMTAEEVDTQERKSFLEWRRGLARLEDNEKLVLTPFEKNLDIWRQLWRVLERSHLVVTVVDARNPLFYRCPDLEASVSELDPIKRCILLLNKADLLPLSARQQWAAYFKKQGVGCLFWSAVEATALLEGKVTEQQFPFPSESTTDSDEGETEETRVLGREELLEKLEAEALDVLREKNMREKKASGGENSGAPTVSEATEPAVVSNGKGRQMAVVGFVGYPNVGKSSTINALVGQKKTGVTSTPGKTKHFQTLLMSDSLMLCDCPGLVFPSFTSARSEMVAAGVLPIDRITDHRGPIQLVAERVPRIVLEEVYGIVLPKPAPHEPPNRPPTAFEVLRAYARSRGYVASSGLPDETRASRQILRDYLNGRLRDYHLPPSEDAEVGSVFVEEGTTRREGARQEGREEEGEGSESEWEEMDEEQGVSGGGDEAHIAAEHGRVSERNQEDSEQSQGLGRELVEGVSANRDEEKDLIGGDDSTVTEDWDSLSLMGGSSNIGAGQRKQPLRAAHKMHKKGARQKDRTWRVGHGGKDDTDGMPIVQGIQKPLSHGAARFATVLPKDRHLVGL